MSVAVTAVARPGVSAGQVDLDVENSPQYPGSCTQSSGSQTANGYQLVVKVPDSLSSSQRSQLIAYIVQFLKATGDFSSVSTTGS